MRILFILIFIPFILKSQTFNYNIVTDLENQCKCKSKIIIKENKVIVRYKNLNVKLKLDKKVYLEKQDKFILHLIDNEYNIDKIVISKSFSIFTYKDGKKSISFLNINKESKKSHNNK
tara:strand:- start:4190 stop:4543 length:354 start_codon:yes stop_codon:yes gene_type:complete